MIIGSDFDGVIADDTEERINYIREKYGKVLPPEQIHGTALEAEIKEGKEDVERQVNNTERTLKFKPMSGVAEVFQKLIAEGDQIVIITGRWKEGVPWARKFLELHGIPYHHIWSTKLNIDSEREGIRKAFALDPALKGKGRLAKAGKLGVFVEDSDAHLKDLAPLKDQVQLFVFDHPYNHNLRISGVERVYNWYEIYEKIQQLKGAKV